MYINDFDKILNCYQKTLLIGNLSSKHTIWNCKSTNSNGLKLYKYLTNYSTIISTPDSHTYFSYDQNKDTDILDIVLLKSIPFTIHQKLLFELDSDHLPVKISIDASLSFLTPTNKLINGKTRLGKIQTIYHTKATNFKKYSEHIQSR